MLQSVAVADTQETAVLTLVKRAESALNYAHSATLTGDFMHPSRFHFTGGQWFLVSVYFTGDSEDMRGKADRLCIPSASELCPCELFTNH